ncbi:bifunctional acetaldehyde-CoA/alcohol dehydrogenase [Sedimentisphaera salicampi]|uniref:bifunctional acetaldehyde-CoA/alcohol dehydrogenase n=1 Tax=Sedimentisphaera salicampi TaxID=1941349 RepID=UPI000B9CFFE2|nr:bifunctional acetaldehyde-CoA/alcohol dehydrogenase [Sedimentisphaera salicampi]OXU15822.1 Aldehyde-alcohol dehydrogenase [Sedimentisphaera salicampi]
MSEALNKIIAKAKKAQETFADFDQEKVDKIFHKAAVAANDARIPLAKMAAEETGMGVFEDKVLKNHFASEFVYNKFRDTKTCGVIERDEDSGIVKVAEPVGVIGGIIPTTNPTSTAIFKSLLALKTRNAIIFSPHPRAKKCTVESAKTILNAAVSAGAPDGLIAWIEEPTVDLSRELMTHPDIAMILATGGGGMVKAAYSSGKPAIGVGSGNTPVVIDETCDIEMAVSSVLLSKTFDNGLICASEQAIIVCDEVYDKVKKELEIRGAHLLSKKDKKLMADTIVIDGKLNTKIVGQPAAKIAEMGGVKVNEDAKVLIAEAEKIGDSEPFSREKLSPVLGMFRAKNYANALEKAEAMVQYGGMGHTSVLYTDPANQDRIQQFGRRMKTGRTLVNMPSSQGAIGDLYNFKLEPSLTLGCGSWGGNSVSENVGVKHLLNVKTIAERRENMLWFKVPPQVYFKYNCLETALGEIADHKRAVLVTDKPLVELGITDKVTSVLEKLGIECEIFYDVKPDPDLSTVRRGLDVFNSFKPDTVIALGGGSPIDAAKIMWMMYEYPDIQFKDLAMRFMDIRKRIVKFPEMGKKATMVAIPTTSGTGSEVTPFSVITDDTEGIKYPIADYELTPDMAIVDAALVMSMPKGLTAASGIDAVTHAIEAIAAVTATDYTNGLAMESLRILFKYLPIAYNEGNTNVKAREKVHNAATMAGMAFANAFLGLCHSMAHKLGSAFHIPHGVANAILIPHVIRYNATDKPLKQAAFSQYTHPVAKMRFAKIADYLCLGGKSEDEKIEKLIAKIKELSRAVDIPETISDCGVSEKDFNSRIQKLSESAFDDQCTGTNPRYPLISEIEELYRSAYK